MSAFLQLIHFLAGLIVLAEALNKLERVAPFAPGIDPHTRLVDGLKALAWALLALGAGGAVATPVLGEFGIHSRTSQMITHQLPSLAETLVLVGFAVLIIRTRVKEG